MDTNQTEELQSDGKTASPLQSRLSLVAYITGLMLTVFALVVGFLQFHDPAWRQWSAMLLAFGLSPALLAFALTRAVER